MEINGKRSHVGFQSSRLSKIAPSAQPDYFHFPVEGNLETFLAIMDLRVFHMGASHLSCCPTLLHLDHLPDERRLVSWSISEEKRKEKRTFEKSSYPAGDSYKEKRVFWKVYAWIARSVKVATLF